MQELFWLLLLPVAAASGWVAARRTTDRDRRQEQFHGAEYFRGLNYLLDNRPDKAIDVFIRMVEVDQDTVETHLALGSLFRRRGEVDRAIQIHQNLIARPSLTLEQRARAQLELGEDYMKAGVYDRAEGLFQELLGQSEYTTKALEHLSVIYQHERDWAKAINNAQELERFDHRSHANEIAHFYCEFAEEALRSGDAGKARQYLRKAVEFDTKCVRASLLEARLVMGEDDYLAALDHLHRVEQQDAGFVILAVKPLQECYRKLDRESELIDYLGHLLEQRPSGYLIAVLTEQYEQQYGLKAAEEFLLPKLRRHPSVPGLRKLFELKLDQELAPGESSSSAIDEVRVLYEVSRPLLDARLRYKCTHCGFEGRSLHWRCPSCQHWSTVRPKEGS